MPKHNPIIRRRILGCCDGSTDVSKESRSVFFLKICTFSSKVVTVSDLPSCSRFTTYLQNEGFVASLEVLTAVQSWILPSVGWVNGSMQPLEQLAWKLLTQRCNVTSPKTRIPILLQFRLVHLSTYLTASITWLSNG
jgi:hypothetical protein